MSKETFRGIVIGVVLSVIVGYGVLYAINLNARITGIERFLQQAINNQNQQQQRLATVADKMTPK